VHRRRSRRTTAVVAAVVSSLVLSVGFSSASTVDELRDDLNGTRDELDRAADDLDRTRQEKGTAAEQVRAADAMLGQLAGELAALEGQLTAAQAEAAGAAERTEAARTRLRVLDQELEDTAAYLAEREKLLADRAVAAFMFGSVSYAAVVVEAESVTDFVNTTYFLRAVLTEDKAVIEDVEDLTAELATARAEADRLREVVEAEQRSADEAAATLVTLTAEQERVTALAAGERARRSQLLQQLEVHEAATEAQIAELEVESAALEKELRNARWRAGAPGDGTWVWPTSGQITSNYGYRTHPIYGTRRLHTGVDISGGWGQQIVAANDGLVISAYCSGGGYGCRIVIDHGGGIASLYAHQSSFAVAEGTVVAAGQVIGYVGSTGASTGPHLHFEIRRNGAPENPMAQY
jgi:murein DD-endopeptidase MepM/ murein hydrolase activator NlpD